MIKIKRALISVSDKKNVIELAKVLASNDVEILSTGGTAKLLKKNRIPVIEVEEYTNFPEMLGGRVKTLHPRIHGGILGIREDKDHIKTMEENDIPQIDLVVVNLYPFEKTIQKPDCTLEEAIENIDIGGPTMIRAAAKNYKSVAVLTNPDDYTLLTEKLTNKNNMLDKDFLFDLSKKAFLHTAEYDAAISSYLHKDSDENFPKLKIQVLTKKLDMRYGENPHQKAAFYCDKNVPNSSLSNFSQLHGKELSFNNLNDANNAWECVKSFDQPTCVIVKHANPCGVCSASTISKAYLGAFATDPTSAFGGIIAFNKEINEETALLVMNQFVEVIIAPSFSDKAMQIFKTKDNIRLLSVPIDPEKDMYDFKKIAGGWLVQSTDDHKLNINECEVVSKLKPTKIQLEDMLFAWKVGQFVKSNAIVFCNKGQTLGVGAGQMSRIDSTKIAGIKARNAGLSLIGSVVASDAFFPFRDGVDELAKYGAKCVIQPGGSLRDKEVIDAADEHGLVMIFTKIRHFKH
tara:strand:+ start:17275 stop:18825 length:1551 start_codon:yes stop_codon:yes gene_type:complete